MQDRESPARSVRPGIPPVPTRARERPPWRQSHRRRLALAQEELAQDRAAGSKRRAVRSRDSPSAPGGGCAGSPTPACIYRPKPASRRVSFRVASSENPFQWAKVRAEWPNVEHSQPSVRIKRREERSCRLEAPGQGGCRTTSASAPPACALDGATSRLEERISGLRTRNRPVNAVGLEPASWFLPLHPTSASASLWDGQTPCAPLPTTRPSAAAAYGPDARPGQSPGRLEALGGRLGRRKGSGPKKERRRTESINSAFAELRECIPNVPADTKLSKIKTLRLATSYIAYLMDVLAKDAQAGDPEAFKAELKKADGGRESKRKRELERETLGQTDSFCGRSELQAPTDPEARNAVSKLRC
ncbi:Heart- and neural crest derivatives-expressed protein 1 [Tupaia chinensis]|uniref:Heart- and neural crest derivatives-expressed protein 1 n=1 Tax=Tupaia chinensis TaxID=246437 RepID=L8Y7S5_TUPCH|nr:Heart- and neural crest derivatives-expressed protein 1 [Tupaia chinensis]